MLNKNLFEKGKEEWANEVEKSFFTLANFDNSYNSILKVDNLDNPLAETNHIFPAEEIVQIGFTLGKERNKNIFILNEAFSDDLKNANTGLLDNFFKIYIGLKKTLSKNNDLKEKDINLSILNMQCPVIHHENDLAAALYLNNRETKNDIATLRNLSGINIFVPADAVEADYLLKITEKNFFKKGQSNFSYFKLSNAESPKIFDEEYFEKDGNLKEWTGMPEIVYLSKSLEANFEIAIIANGPILYNALLAAKELEDRNYKVTVLNMSLISSSSEYLNQKIKSFINSFIENHKNILTIEEHSKVGGMGSFVAESVLENRHVNNIRVERMGLEDDLSPRNIISKCEEIAGF